MLAVTSELYAMALPELERAHRIAELGCYTGSFTDFIARRHPDVEVIGVDRIAVREDTPVRDISNLTLVSWDYEMDSAPPAKDCDVLVSSFGIDFGPECWEGRHSLDAMDLRGSSAYMVYYRKAKPILERWGRMAKDDARLFAGLRLSNPVHGLAIIDAAHDSGWEFDAAHSRKVSVEEETFPVMAFSREVSGRLDEDEIISWWIANDLGEEGLEWEGGVALAFYRAFANRVMIDEVSQTYDDGHTMRVETGRQGPFGYVLKIATTGYVQLKLIGRDELEEWPTE